MMVRVWLMAAALAIATVLPARAAAPEWDLLGTRRVSFAAERDVIEIGAREGRFSAIKLDVEGGNLEMYDVRITFGDGETWSPATYWR